MSLALGAFVAGMLISENGISPAGGRGNIKPFRDVLMGLFFVTIGVKLDMHLLVGLWWQVLSVLAALLLIKGGVVGLLSWRLGATPGNAIRAALWLCAGGEFGFVLLGEIHHLPKAIEQVVLTALVLSMLIAPFIVQYSEKLSCARRQRMAERSMHYQIAAQSMGTEKHAILCGFGATASIWRAF